MSNVKTFNLFTLPQIPPAKKSVTTEQKHDVQKIPPTFASQGNLLFSIAAKPVDNQAEPNSIKVLKLLNECGKCNRAEFATAYIAKHKISMSLALSEISKLERTGKINCDNPEPLKPQSKLRTIEITEAGRLELIKPSYLKTQVQSDLIPGKVNLPTGLLALLNSMSSNGPVKYTEFMYAAAKHFGHAQGRTTLSGRIANMQSQNEFVRTYLDESGVKFIAVTPKGKAKLEKDRDGHLITPSANLTLK